MFADSFFRFFVKRNLLANMFTLLMLIIGLFSFFSIKRDINPNVDFDEMFISTRYPGASPEDVELKVTNEIEDELKTVSGIEKFTSYSIEDISVIHLKIDPGEDEADDVKTEIRDAVAAVTDLPPEVRESPKITELKTSSFPVIELGISGNIEYKKLRQIAKEFSRKLENINGVSKIKKYGYLNREVHIEALPKELKENHISLREMIRAISSRNIRATGGSFESYTSEKNVVTLAQFEKPKDVGDVIVRTTFDGPSIRISDIAEINDTFEEETTNVRMNAKPSITFLCNKTDNADIIATCDEIKKLVQEEKKKLPEGVDIAYTNDASKYVRSQFNIVRTNGLMGLVLLFVLLALFLNIRMSIWVAMGIPITLSGVMFLLPIFGSHLDTVTLTGFILVIGIIVDDGIIISEQIFRRFELGDSPIDAAVNGIRNVFLPVITTILTTFLAFAPMFFMPGIMGKFCKFIPLVISLALFVSVFEVIIALPAHVASSLKKIKIKKNKSTRTWFDSIRSHFEKILYKLLAFKYLIITFALASLISTGWYAVNFMDFVLFPSTGADLFYVQMELPIGTSLKATSEKVKEIEKIILDMPKTELDSFVTRIGELGDANGQVESPHYATIWVSLTPFGQRDRTADTIVEQLKEKASIFKGYHRLIFRVESGGPPVGRPITIRCVGGSDKVRKKLADDLETYLKTIDGIKDIDRDDKKGKEQIQIQIDYEKLARLGLTVEDIAQTVRIAYDGQIVTNVRYGDEDVDFRVLIQAKARADQKYLENMLIPNNTNKLVPLKQVAKLINGPGPSKFYHYDGHRSTTVSGDVIKEKITPLQAIKKVTDHFDLSNDYPGTRFVIGGEAEETQDSIISLMVALGVAALAIYFLLILLFNSVKQPFLVMLAMPFGLIGVVIAFGSHHEPLGFLAMMGVIGLMGVVVNDSLVLVAHINDMRKNNPDLPIRKMVSIATSERLRAIIMTTLTTVAGLLPLAYGIGGKDPFMSPMALALGWGLLLATPLTLVLIPCFYLILERDKKEIKT